MRVVLKQKNLTFTPAIREYVEKKLVSPVQKLVGGGKADELVILEIEIARTTTHHRKGLVYYAEANVSRGKTLIRVEAQDQDIYAAIDALKDELEGRLKSLKEKSVSVARTRARSAKQIIRQKM